MSLRLRQAVPGRPSVLSSQSLEVGAHNEERYIAYTSSSNVVLLTPELELLDTLEFWSALPPRAAGSSGQGVHGVRCVDGLIIAWSGVHVVLWHRASRGKRKWAVHSTLVASKPITTLDFSKASLVLGTLDGLECWRMEDSDDIVVWDRMWDRNVPAPYYLTISSNTGHVSWYAKGERSVHVLATNKKGEAVGRPQELRHPREISHILWRQSQTSDDAHLYTVTGNSVLRIYSPVLDDPAWFQLLSTLDGRSFALVEARSRGKGKMGASVPGGVIWPLDATALCSAVQEDLRSAEDNRLALDKEVKRLLDGLNGDESDVIAWIGNDGVVSFRSIINMDRKPPTLLKSLPLIRLQLDPSETMGLSPQTRLLYTPSSSKLLAVTPAGDDSIIAMHRLFLRDILGARASGLKSLSPKQSDSTTIHLSDTISNFVRTPNGRGILAMGREGEIGVWYADRLSKPKKGTFKPDALLGRGRWKAHGQPTAMAIFAKGRAIVSYGKVDGKPTITLQHLDEGRGSPSEPVTLPHLDLEDGDEVEMLLAVSDIDDGFSARGRRTQRAYIMAASRRGHAWVWRVDSRLSGSAPTSPAATTKTLPNQSSTPSTSSPPPDILLQSRYALPLSGELAFILPVDPMGWHQSVVDWKSNFPLQDMILTISKDGVLEFWSPELGHHFEHERPHHHHSNGNSHTHQPWSRTGFVSTGITDAIMARCSSRKKTAIIRETDGHHEMTIWDSKTSEFSTGLELTHSFLPGEIVQDLDWTTTSDLQSVLAVGFKHKVVLVCEQRMSYVETSPGWAPFLEIDMRGYTSIPISDSIWLAEGSLAIGTGNQIYLFSRFLDRDTPTTTPATSLRRVEAASSMPGEPRSRLLQEESDEPEDLFQLIAYESGPLWDYHPTVLSQCLLWNKIDLVKQILLDLLDQLKQAEILNSKRLRYKRLDPTAFVSTKTASIVSPKKNANGRYDGLFGASPITNGVNGEDDAGHTEFTARAVSDLTSRLDGPVRIPLTPNEKALLATVAQAVLEVERQRRSLDLCGLRYLLAIRMFVNINNHPASGTSTPIPNGNALAPATTSASPGVKPQSLLSFRNVVWATHSESQDVLLAAATETCPGGKMLWEDANSLGVFCWLKSSEVIKLQLEVVARNRFMADEDRDPTTCSLIFFALGKRKIVHGLWRQAPGHKEQTMMLKFLANDFELDRWKTAAVKNAYALLSKQRYEYAAAFFMLAGQAKDATNVVLRHLDDWQLAFALARAVEGSLDGPIVKSILNDLVLPRAFQGGHRWLASWGFWVLGRRDLAVRVLISPMTDVASSWSFDKTLVGDPANDDPSLLLLFQHLKSKSLQTAKGTSEIPEKTEFDFVLHNARVFFRLGCHALGLDLLHSWSFDRPFFPAPRYRVSSTATPVSGVSNGISGTPLSKAASARLQLSPSARRRPSFMLSAHGRGESMVMDMEMEALDEGESTEPSRVPSPAVVTPDPQDALGLLNGVTRHGVDTGQRGTAALAGSAVDDATSIAEESAKPKKVGNLMKELQADVQQGATEFNMDNFF